jgi:hypothetical protein
MSMKVGILIPVCSRNQSWTTYDECYLATAAMPSLQKTFSEGFDYQIYIGVDSDDTFFLNCNLPGIPVIVENCQNAPAHVWNHLFKRAMDDGCEYVLQMADDVVIETPGWTERFIAKLQETNNRGVVGPCHRENYLGRLRDGKPFVLENAFVHRTHYELFGYFYPWEIRNWYCDDWITRVYEGYMFEDILVHNLSIRTGTQRYTIDYPDWKRCIEDGKVRACRGCFSFCLYGDTTDKYYRGLYRNVVMIREHYPTWDIVVYTAPEAVEFVKSLEGVQCIPTGCGGTINMVYRFLHVLDTQYDVVCVRDADSRINERDRWCIRQFLDSSYSMYTIRDHPWHRYRIMGGLWGVKRGNHFSKMDLHEFCERVQAEYTTDTRFLEQYLLTQNRVVYSYDPSGLFGDPNEKVIVIDSPGDFCGNVILFDENGTEYPQFTR